MGKVKAGKKIVKGLWGMQSKLKELASRQHTLSPAQMRESLADLGVDMSVKVKPNSAVAELRSVLKPKSELNPKIYKRVSNPNYPVGDEKYTVYYTPPNAPRLGSFEQTKKINKHFSDFLDERTKFYNEGKKFRKYLTHELKPYSSAEELAKDEMMYTHSNKIVVCNQLLTGQKLTL